MAPAKWLLALWLLAVSLAGLALAAAPFVRNDDPEPPRHKTFTNSVGMRFVQVKAGKFLMGSPKKEAHSLDDEHPRHEVEITRDFYVGIHEVTQKQYLAVMRENPSAFRKGGDGTLAVRGLDTSDFPVENVSWVETQEFLETLNDLAAEKKARVKYYLPTEAEWEYACRGGHLSRQRRLRAELPFHFKKPSASLGFGQANFDASVPYDGGQKGDDLGRTCEVGSYQPNALGIYDMHGNVREWCSDRYAGDFYKNSPKKDPGGPATGDDRVFRGGAWEDEGQECRAAQRNGSRPDHYEGSLGFRVVAVRKGG